MAPGTATRLNSLPPLTTVPQHVAIIMDGNGRWARQRGLPRLEGHRAGTENIRRIVEACVEFGAKFLTLYAFSTENWRRPQEEVRGLFALLGRVLDREAEELHRKGVQIRHLGSLDDIPDSLARRVRQAVERTRANSRLVLSVAFNYGGRAEIVQAVQRLIRSGVPAEAVSEQVFASYLYTDGLPDPDLVIRTAGEMRLSNFLLWQAAYAEYWSTPDYWPDFGPAHLHEALSAYAARQRRFGNL